MYFNCTNIDSQDINKLIKLTKHHQLVMVNIEQNDHPYQLPRYVVYSTYILAYKKQCVKEGRQFLLDILVVV